MNEASKTMTARDLARLIGVSQSAVSRAFTPGASISEDLRQRILAAAQRFGYRPNVIASILSRQKSDIIALVVSDLRNPYYPGLLERLSRSLQARGLQCLLFNIAPGSDVRQQLMALRQYHVDALVVISATVLSAEEIVLAAEGRRVVLVNRIAPEARLTTVSCDNAHGARAIADHFHALGRRRAAFVAGLTGTVVSLQRQNAFVTRLAELGMTLTASIGAGEYSYEAGYRAGLELGRAGGTDAVFFANDILALGGLDALREGCGVRVPEDIAVAGFDDIPMANWPHYSLTTYRQPIDELVGRILDVISGGDATPALHLLEGDMVVRRSTTPPV